MSQLRPPVQRRWLSLWLTAALFGLSAAPAAASATSQQTDHAAALAQYERAIAQGNKKPALRYNRAVTLVKLGRTNEAIAAFRELLSEPQWAAVARYNLGLIAEQQQRPADALRWYREVLASTDNPRLTLIAERKIAQLADPATNRKPTNSAHQKNMLLVSVGAVADDNATGLAEELAGSAANAKDTYIQSLAYGQTYWSSTKLYALVQTRHFQTFEHFDTRVLGGGAEWQTATENWQWRYGLRALDIQVNDGDLSTQITGHLGSQKQWRGQRFSWHYNLSHFAASRDYRHLQGLQHQVQLSWQKTWDAFALEPALLWEYNDRQDKRSASTFYSYSPRILTGQLKTSWQASAKWQIYASSEFAQAEYAERNRLTDIGGINKDQKRTYDRTTLSVGTRYQLQKHWQLKVDYQTLHNDDRFDLYSYDKNTVSVKIDFVF